MSKPESREGFSKDYRLRRSWEFLYCKDKGKRVRGRHFVISFAEPLTDKSRLGVIVSKKVDKRATRRNKVKRRIREIFRKNKNLFAKTIDLVVIARQNAGSLSFEDTKEELIKLYKKAGILRDVKVSS